jgi:hypothetical protein
METRELKIGIAKAGGNAGSGSKRYIIMIPAKWAKDMGVDQDRRTTQISYDEEKKEITIKLKEE